MARVRNDARLSLGLIRTHVTRARGIVGPCLWLDPESKRCKHYERRSYVPIAYVYLALCATALLSLTAGWKVAVIFERERAEDVAADMRRKSKKLLRQAAPQAFRGHCPVERN